MKGLSQWLCTATVLLTAVACGSSPPPQESQPERPAPDANARIQAMSDLLSGSPALTVIAHEVHERKTQEGSVSRIEGKQTLTLRRPDRLHIKAVATGARTIDHELYYDGAQLVLENHVQKVWAGAAVPPTVDEMLDQVAWRFNLPITLADMIYSSPFDALVTDDTVLGYAGIATEAGADYDRFTGSHEIVDWELWLPVDGAPVPHRLIVVHKTLEGVPRSDIRFDNFDFEATPEDARFVFVPKKGYTPIPVVENPPPSDAGSVTVTDTDTDTDTDAAVDSESAGAPKEEESGK